MLSSRSGPDHLVTALDALRGRPVNYDPGRAPDGGRAEGHWHVDAEEIVVGREAPGPPAEDGPFAAARELIRHYEFTDGRIVRAVYRPADSLPGRDMLLEGRFAGLRFYLGVRVTGVTDETRDGKGGPEQAWGWAYQTLQGHLEQGRLSYEVIKNLGTGQVVFRVSGYSRAAPIPNLIIRLGFALFGRLTQRRFYTSVQHRMRAVVQASEHGAALPEPAVRADGLVIAPARTRRTGAAHPARSATHPGG